MADMDTDFDIGADDIKHSWGLVDNDDVLVDVIKATKNLGTPVVWIGKRWDKKPGWLVKIRVR